MIELKITANSHEELQNQIRQFFTEAVENRVEAKEPKTVEAEVVEEKPKKKTKKKSSKKASSNKKEEPTTDHAQSEQNPTTQKSTTSKGFTADDTYKALQEVSTTVSLAAAREVLTSFDCERISALEEKDYEAFIEACSEAVAKA